MDITFNESDVKKIVSAYLEAKGNKVSDISVQIAISNRPGSIQNMILANMGTTNPTGLLTDENSPNRPTFSLKCSVIDE